MATRWDNLSPKDRFMEKVLVLGIDDCWEWLASKNMKGYGQFEFKIAGRRIHGMAHRFSWMLEKGKIPNKMLVCHHCDNPSCVNPKHLFLGTNQDNMNDRNKKNRQARPRGSKNGFSMLNEESVKEIRKLISFGKLYLDIAREFGVCRSTISAIATGQNWAWLE